MVRVRPRLVVLVSAVLVALLLSAAHAVDPATFACEDKGIDALRKFADTRVACLERCWRAQIKGATGRVCVDDADPDTPPTLDAKTLACVQKTGGAPRAGRCASRTSPAPGRRGSTGR